MGNPLHFSVELPQRCLQLIDALWPHVEKTAKRIARFGRAYHNLSDFDVHADHQSAHRADRTAQNAQSEGYADDRCIDPKVAAPVLDSLGGQPLSRAPFYSPGEWSFATYAERRLFNIAREIPHDLATELRSDQAAARADKMPTSQWCSILRNAMAHGGIAYLNENGRTSYGEPVKMYAFVSGAFDDTDRMKLLRLNVLRISEVNYRKFLRRWVAWLKSSGLANELGAA